jgi:hypothetical protein
MADLMRVVEQYKVVWAVYPEWGPDEHWRQQKVGFDLELIGTHFQPQHPPSPGCPECRQVYDALHQIAEWILPKAERRSRYEIDAFDGKLAMSLRHGLREEITLTIRIVHRDDYRRPVDECENTCLAEMERNLSALGAERE